MVAEAATVSSLPITSRTRTAAAQVATEASLHPSSRITLLPLTLPQALPRHNHPPQRSLRTTTDLCQKDGSNSGTAITTVTSTLIPAPHPLVPSGSTLMTKTALPLVLPLLAATLHPLVLPEVTIVDGVSSHKRTVSRSTADTHNRLPTAADTVSSQ